METTLTEAEARELAQILNRASDLQVGRGHISARFREEGHASRAFELLRRQGRQPQRIDSHRLTARSRS